MAQFATREEGGGGPQSMPFGYDPNWLAQQPGNLHFGLSDNFSIGSQHRSGNVATGSILTQNDNNLLGDFFSNPDITNQMTFDYDDPAGDSKAQRTSDAGLYDIDDGMSVLDGDAASYHLNHGGVYHAQPDNSQQPRMSRSNQVSSSSGGGNHEQVGEAEEEEDTKASVAAGLMNLAANGQNASHMAHAGTSSYAASWGGWTVPAQNHIHMSQGLHNFHPGGLPAMHQQFAQAPHHMHGQMISSNPNPISYWSSPHQSMQRDFSGSQAQSSHLTGRPPSTGGSFTNNSHGLPQTHPGSIHFAGGNFTGFRQQSSDNRSVSHAVFGSDRGFESNSYGGQDNYNDIDEKHTNLTRVPHAEALRTSNSVLHQPLPGAGGYQVQAYQARGPQSPFSHPPTPTIQGYTNFAGGLPAMSNGAMAGYGRPGVPHAYAHGHGGHVGSNLQQHPRHNHAAMNANNGRVKEVRGGHDGDDEAMSSAQEESEQDTLAHPSASAPQEARKRRKSDYQADAEDDYEPPVGGKRRAKDNLNDSDGEEETYRPESNSSRKRVRSHQAPRESVSNSASARSSPAVRTPRHQSFSSAGKRSSRKSRESGSQIQRANLTEDQRRDNHIKSEKNRRDLIKTYYSELNSLIPALKGGKSGLSRAEVLKEIVEFIEELMAGNDLMEGLLEKKNPSLKGQYDDGFSSDDDEEEEEGEGGAAKGVGDGGSSVTAY